MGFCGGCAKALLIVFNFIFWLSGLAILGVGIWMIVDKNISSYFEVLNIDTHDQFFRYAAYILIAFGAFVFLVGFCGCCGAIRGSKCLLGMYIFFLVIIFAGEIAAGVMMILYKVQIEDKVDETLAKSIKNKYGQSATITEAWDIVQIQLDCCGGTEPSNYNNSNYFMSNNRLYPNSCCVLTNKGDAEGDPSKATPKDLNGCLNGTVVSAYHNIGCKDGLIDWAKMHTGILIGVGIGIGCLQIFGIIFACCLCRQVAKEEKY